MSVSSIQNNPSRGTPPGSPRVRPSPAAAVALPIFQAQKRAEPKSLKDYVFIVLKVALFPLTAICYLVHLICHKIAFKIGVVGDRSKVISQEIRNRLQRNLNGTSVTFKTVDQVTLEGMYFANPRPNRNSKTILICSGSHQSYEHYVEPLVDGLKSLGHHVMVFNYRGFGASEGSPSANGFNLDAEAAYQYLKERHQAQDDTIVAWGYSMGSKIAADLGAHHPIKVVLDRYFSSMKAAAKDRGGFLANLIFKIGGASFDVADSLISLKGRALLARGHYDQTMRAHHQTTLQHAVRNLPNQQLKYQFMEVSSGHMHYGNAGLWAHPENLNNQAERATLNQFLSSI